MQPLHKFLSLTARVSAGSVSQHAFYFLCLQRNESMGLDISMIAVGQCAHRLVMSPNESYDSKVRREGEGARSAHTSAMEHGDSAK